MFTRLVSSAISLALVVVAYQLYAKVMEPLLEPEIAFRAPRPLTPSERTSSTNSVTRYQRLLAAYFPADHWSQTSPPKVIQDASGEAMLVLGKYEHSSVANDGIPVQENPPLPEQDRVTDTIVLEQCAFLLFPTPLVAGRSPPRDAVIIEFPPNAKLRFHDFNVTQGKIGQLVSGEFDGQVIIRSDMREPGPQDDLLLTTRNIRLTSKMLWTEEAVQFRLGPNVGGGKHLEIDFLEDERAASKQGGLKIAGARFLEIRSEVAMTLFMQKETLLPTDRAPGGGPSAPQGAVSAAAAGGPLHLGANTPPADLPVDVRCTGPFRFDFSRYVASFEENVDVWQLDPNGPTDHMACQQLDVHFAPDAAGSPGSLAATAAASASARQKNELGKLKPYKLVATGYPVVIDSPKQEVQARGNRVTVQLDSRKFTLEGGGVSIQYGPSVLTCPALQYEDPPPGSGAQLGNLWAEGPGSLRYVPDLQKPAEVFQVTWQRDVQLVRRNGQPLLMLSGRPQATMFPEGQQLAADEMHIQLRELSAESVSGVSVAGPGGSKTLNIVPDWMIARDNVVINSPQLSGQTKTLAVQFRMEPPGSESSPSGAGGGRGTVGGLRNQGPSPQSYSIHADQLRLDVALRGQDAEVTNVSCDGNVVFRETRTRRPEDEPLVVHGWSLSAQGIDRPESQIVVRGFPGDDREAPRPAEVTARGMTLQSSSIHLDQGRNRLWIDGAGTIRLTADRDPSGQPLARPMPVAIHWSGGLNFDGTHIVINRDVRLEAPDNRIHAHQLIARVSRPILLGSGTDTGTIEVAEVTCVGDEVAGDVVIEHWSRDEQGKLSSHEHVNLKRLVINQQTGVIDGVGPGTVRSWRYSAPLEVQSAGATTAPAPPRDPVKRLHYLEVRFQRGLNGNLEQRWLTFHQRVTSVYGPVDAWEQLINPDLRGGLPPGGVAMNSDELTVSEIPTYQPNYPINAAPASNSLGQGGLLGGLGKNQVGPLELLAKGNVTIEGHLEDRRQFFAQAQRAAYNQSKNSFDLEGTPNNLATVTLYSATGGVPTVLPVEKLTILLSPWRVIARKVGSIDLTPESAGRGQQFQPR